MDKSMTMKIAAIVVVVIVIAAACIVLVGNDKDSDDGNIPIESSLMIRGNADNNYTIDNDDMQILKDIIAGDKKLADYPLADIDGDGNVTDTDTKILQDMIDRKTGTTIYVETLDRTGKNVTVTVQYPLRNIVTYATNMEMPVVYAGGGQYIAGYFTKSYDNAQASVASTARDLEGSQRQITDASWANFTKLDSDLKTSGGIGAFLVDYSGISQITAARSADLEAANIPMLAYESADSMVESATVITLSWLFGENTETIGQKYAQLRDRVMNEINEKLSNLQDSDKKTYMCFTMYIFICGPDSTFASTPKTAHGIPYSEVNEEFSKKYTKNSTKMDSVEALSNYTDVDCLINNRSIDWQTDADAINKMIVSTWDHSNNGTPSSEYFKGFEDKLVYVNNLLPGPAKLAFIAAALYGDYFSYSWAQDVLQDCIDIGLIPLQGYTVDQLVPYFDNAVYQKAKA